MQINFNSIPYLYDQNVNGNYYGSCSVEDLESLCFFLKSNIDGVWLIDIFACDETSCGRFLKVNYVFYLVEDKTRIIVQVDYKKNAILTSISHLYRNSSVYEQELFELFGVKFDRNYNSLLFDEENNIFPLLKDELRNPKAKTNQKEQHVLLANDNILKNQLLFNLELKNDIVKHCHIYNGHYHVGVEKIQENLTLQESFYILESLFSNYSVEWSFLLAKNCEDSLSIQIPERAKALRMILLEFSRISHHMRSIRDLMKYLGNENFYKQSMLWMKRVQSLYISFCGNEYLKNTIRVGGVIRDVNQAWLSRAIDDLMILEKEIEFFKSYIFHNSDIKNILNIHLIHKMNAFNFCLSGPLVRACGINLDFRKTDPFYYYKDVDFKVPIATSGNAYDLLSVKIEEVFQSISIILQVLDNLPTGSCMDENYIDFSNIEKSYNSDNEENFLSRINKLYKFDENFESYTFIEGPNGLMNNFIDYKLEKIQRFRAFTNDSIIKSVFETITVGRDVGEIELIWNVLYPEMKHIER